MNIEQIKNTLREFQAENRQKFKNTQAEFKKAVSSKKVYWSTFTPKFALDQLYRRIFCHKAWNPL